MTHSIPDAVGLAIRTPVGTVVHTGDFKLDQTPLDGRLSDLRAARRAAAPRASLLLLSDSTNVEHAGRDAVGAHASAAQLEAIFRRGRRAGSLVTTFSSHIHRMQQVIDCAVRFGRQGRARRPQPGVARRRRRATSAYLRVPDGVLVDLGRRRATCRAQRGHAAHRRQPGRAALGAHPHRHGRAQAGDAGARRHGHPVVARHPGQRARRSRAWSTTSTGAAPSCTTTGNAPIARLGPRLAGGAEAGAEPDPAAVLRAGARRVPPPGATPRLAARGRDGVRRAAICSRTATCSSSTRQGARRGRARARPAASSSTARASATSSDVVLRDRRHLSEDGLVLAILAIAPADRRDHRRSGPRVARRRGRGGEPEVLERAKDGRARRAGRDHPRVADRPAEVKEEVRKALSRFFASVRAATGDRPLRHGDVVPSGAQSGVAVKQEADDGAAAASSTRWPGWLTAAIGAVVALREPRVSYASGPTQPNLGGPVGYAPADACSRRRSVWRSYLLPMLPRLLGGGAVSAADVADFGRRVWRGAARWCLRVSVLAGLGVGRGRRGPGGGWFGGFVGDGAARPAAAARAPSSLLGVLLVVGLVLATSVSVHRGRQSGRGRVRRAARGGSACPRAPRAARGGAARTRAARAPAAHPARRRGGRGAPGRNADRPPPIVREPSADPSRREANERSASRRRRSSSRERRLPPADARRCSTSRVRTTQPPSTRRRCSPARASSRRSSPTSASRARSSRCARGR